MYPLPIHLEPRHELKADTYRPIIDRVELRGPEINLLVFHCRRNQRLLKFA
jgi:hypothetical protein